MSFSRRAFLAAATAGTLCSQQPRLNFVIVLVDDWGATDLSCYGSKFYKTPNMDRFAASGMRFTQAYSACTVCSPSRAAILTGKYPARLHLTDWIQGYDYPYAMLRAPAWTQYLPLEAVTIAEALKPLGYATASIGKWHLTPPGGDPSYMPEKQGFDINRAGTFRGQPQTFFSPYKLPTLTDGPEGEYLTDREQTEASAFIRANREKPFFLYLPHHAVHIPLQAKPAVVEKYKETANPEAPQNNATYAAMIDSVDENFGKLLRTLEETGVVDRTVVILTGDNGGFLPSTKTNLGLRAGKGSAYEGGVRVPLLIRWPGVTKPGSVCDVPVIGYDFFPTMLEGVGETSAADGVSILPLLRGNTKGWARDMLFWHYPHYHPGGAKPYSAMRERDWKLIYFYEDSRVELYNLRRDPEEKQDLAASEPKRAAMLKQRLLALLKETGAQSPVANPAYDAAKASQPSAQARGRND